MSGNLNLAEQIGQAISKHGLFKSGESLLVAVSGGLDSMVLLHLLRALAKTNQWRLTVAHFNHELRGRSSNADERLVEQTAKTLQLPFVAGRADVRTFAQKEKLSLEMAARKLRHQFLAHTAAKRRIGKIALAHHAGDQVELFFIRLLRGAGGEGWGGMKWQSPSSANPHITVTRPLLDQSKEVLATYAKDHKIIFREDATNRSLDIQRNRIRHELLPLLIQHYQPALTQVILRQMEITSAEAEFVTAAAHRWLTAKRHLAFNKLPVAMQRRVLHCQLQERGLPANFDLIERLRQSPDCPVSTNKNNTIVRGASGIITDCPKIDYISEAGCVYIQLTAPKGEIIYENITVAWSRKKVSPGTPLLLKNKVNAECFDADKLGVDIELRHWRRGDRFQPIGMSAPVKLQDLFVNQKVPRIQRDQRVVGATRAGEIFWVEGLRMAEQFKLDESTMYQLQWRWKRL